MLVCGCIYAALCRCFSRGGKQFELEYFCALKLLPPPLSKYVFVCQQVHKESDDICSKTSCPIPVLPSLSPTSIAAPFSLPLPLFSFTLSLSRPFFPRCAIRLAISIQDCFAPVLIHCVANFQTVLLKIAVSDPDTKKIPFS